MEGGTFWRECKRWTCWSDVVVRFLWDARKLRSQMECPRQGFFQSGPHLTWAGAALARDGFGQGLRSEKRGGLNHHGAISLDYEVKGGLLALQLKHFTEQRRVAGAETSFKNCRMERSFSTEPMEVCPCSRRLHIFTPDIVYIPFAWSDRLLCR